VPLPLVHVATRLLTPGVNGTFVGVVIGDGWATGVPPFDDTEQLNPDGIAPVTAVPPLATPSCTAAVLAEVFVLVLGELIATDGMSRSTLREAVPVPNASVHATSTLFTPTSRLTEFVVVLVDGAPSTVQVVPAGIELAPLIV
jgi:hypothetical protein